MSESEDRNAPMVHAQFAASHLSAAANASPLINSELSFPSLLFLLFYLTYDLNPWKYATRGSVCGRYF